LNKYLMGVDFENMPATARILSRGDRNLLPR